MSTKQQVQFSKSASGKQLTIVREFHAPLEQVWKAWTESSLLDQWWAPKPYKAETKTMDFREGGMWLYDMIGPDGYRQFCRIDFKAITPHKDFTVLNGFRDEADNPNTAMPTMHWKNEFQSTATGTTVTIVVTFNTEAELETIVSMGFEEGFTAALGNLDGVLAV